MDQGLIACLVELETPIVEGVKEVIEPIDQAAYRGAALGPVIGDPVPRPPEIRAVDPDGIIGQIDLMRRVVNGSRGIQDRHRGFDADIVAIVATGVYHVTEPDIRGRTQKNRAIGAQFDAAGGVDVDIVQMADPDRRHDGQHPTRQADAHGLGFRRDARGRFQSDDRVGD